MNQQEMARLAETHPEHYSLPQVFYRDPDIYRHDIEQIFLKSWLYAGHQSEIPNVGDWFLFEFDQESVIIVRSSEHEINALLNVCQHRGSRVCVESAGCSKRLTCRYHGWTYDLQGQLKAAAHMGETFDKSGIGLKKIHVGMLAGMIYVNFAEDPAPFSLVTEGLAGCLEAVRPGKCQSRAPPELPDRIELEAGIGKLHRVLSLRPGPPGIFSWTRAGRSRRAQRRNRTGGHEAGQGLRAAVTGMSTGSTWVRQVSERISAMTAIPWSGIT